MSTSQGHGSSRTTGGRAQHWSAVLSGCVLLAPTILFAQVERVPPASLPPAYYQSAPMGNVRSYNHHPVMPIRARSRVPAEACHPRRADR
jgi:hypothetical protein